MSFGIIGVTQISTSVLCLIDLKTRFGILFQHLLLRRTCDKKIDAINNNAVAKINLPNNRPILFWHQYVSNFLSPVDREILA